MIRSLASFIACAFVLTLVGVLRPTTLQGQALPAPEQSLHIYHSPSVRGIFHEPDSLFIVYVFNYWAQRQGTRLALWENVLRPETDRVSRKAMTKNGANWECKIPLAPNASILSYYITDGRLRDDNDQKTFVMHVMNKDGVPVRNAHYFMTSFLQLAGEDLQTRLREAELEIRRYPDNFRAYPLYFGLLLEQEKGSPRGQQRIVELLDQLAPRFSEDVGYLNLCARTWYYILRDQKKGLAYRSRIDARDMWGEVATMVDMDRMMEEQRKKLEGNERKRGTLLNSPFPSVQCKDLKGGHYSFASLKDKPAVVLLWASTSEQSLKMLPPINQLAKEFEDEVNMVAVTTDVSRDVLDECLAKNTILPPVVQSNPGLVEALALDSIPQVFILDAEGMIRSIIIGYRPGIADEIRSALTSLK